METILFIAHTQVDGALPKGALETLSVALDLSKKIEGSSLNVGLFGEDVKKAVDSLATCGASKFFGVNGSEFSSARYGTDVGAIEALIKTSKATLVLAPTTSRFSRAIAGACYRVGGRIDTHISGINVGGGKLNVERWYYRQRMLASFSRKKRPWILVVDSGVFEAWKGDAGSASLEDVKVEVSDDSKNTTVVGVEAPLADAQTIRPDAELLFVAGAGWTKKQADGAIHVKEAGENILSFLNKTKASLGSSKSLVDQSGEGQETLSFMSHLNQIGQTGTTPRHLKGLATCCHGEEPHVIGWRFINERRAINLDPNCGWAQGKADMLYVADAFKTMEKINELL